MPIEKIELQTILKSTVKFVRKKGKKKKKEKKSQNKKGNTLESGNSNAHFQK